MVYCKIDYKVKKEVWSLTNKVRKFRESGELRFEVLKVLKLLKLWLL